MIIKFIQIVIILQIVYAIFSYVRYKIFIHSIEKSDKKNNTNFKKNKNIIIAIPCLREQNYIEDTIKYFTKITDDIPIVIITTQKEIIENRKNKITTQDIIKNKILNKYKNVYWINYPYTQGYMAHQLNYMLDNIQKIIPYGVNLSDTYLALYNADSRPNKYTFDEIRCKVEYNKVVQQYSYCMLNYEKLNNILKGFSIYQSNFELRTGLVNSYFNSKFLYTHVVGHGLVINMELLKKLGGFNTEFWCEDVYLGLQLKFNDISIIPLLTLENMETPDTLYNLIRQNSVWFKTTSQFMLMYKDILKSDNVKNKLHGKIGVFNEFRCALNWLFLPIILILCIIGGIVVKKYILLGGIAIGYMLCMFVNTYTTINIINKLDNKNHKISFSMVLSLAIATFISNIGPLYAIFVNKKEKHKTER